MNEMMPNNFEMNDHRIIISMNSKQFDNNNKIMVIVSDVNKLR